jgi:hypothetical protein
MNTLNIKNLNLLGLFAVLLCFSCSTGKSNGTDETGPEYTSAYVCPMHCEGSGSDSMGSCPVCGMEYVENPNYKGGEEARMYACPMHPEITGQKGDNCSICGMNLEPKESENDHEHNHN